MNHLETILTEESQAHSKSHEFVYPLLCSSLFLDIVSVKAVAIET